MVAPIILAVAALVAGHPVNVTCDVSDASATFGYSIVGGDAIHLRSSYCGVLAGNPTDAAFGEALSVLVHESSHTAGVRRESCAQTWVFALYPTVLSRFWGVTAQSPLETQIAAEVGAHARQEPPAYTPAPCTAPDPSPPTLAFAPTQPSAVPRHLIRHR